MDLLASLRSLRWALVAVVLAGALVPSVAADMGPYPGPVTYPVGSPLSNVYPMPMVKPMPAMPDDVAFEPRMYPLQMMHVRPSLAPFAKEPPVSPWLTPCTPIETLPPQPPQLRRPTFGYTFILHRGFNATFQPFVDEEPLFLDPFDDFASLGIDGMMAPLAPPSFRLTPPAPGTTCGKAAVGEAGEGNLSPYPMAKTELLQPCSGVVRFDGLGSTDVDGLVTSYRWDFGDVEGERGDGVIAEHTYQAPGTYRIGLTITDDAGASSQAAGYVRIPRCENGKPIEAQPTVGPNFPLDFQAGPPAPIADSLRDMRPPMKPVPPRLLVGSSVPANG